MSKYKGSFPPTYQDRVGMWPQHSFLTENSKELADFLDGHELLKDGINIFEIGSGGCRNLKYIHDKNNNVNLFASDLHKEASLRNTHESIKDKVIFYGIDTLTLISEYEPEEDIDIFISSDHLMHIDKESVIEIIDNLKTKWKPKYILFRELYSLEGQEIGRRWPRVYHEHNLEDVYDLIDTKSCKNNPNWYNLRLHKLKG